MSGLLLGAISGPSALASALSENVDTWMAEDVAAHDAERNPRPRHSCGAKATAWSRPSSRPHLCSISARTVSTWEGFVTSISRVGGSDGSEGAEPDRDADEVVDISGTEPVGEMTAGSVASLVECRDWNEATPEQQVATIADVRSQINLEDSGVEAPALTDSEAQEVFDDACRPAWAGGFRLYKIYARAAGFIPLQRAIGD